MKSLQHFSQHVCGAMLVHDAWIVIMNGSKKPFVPIGNNAWYDKAFRLEVPQEVIIPGPKFVARQKDP